MLTRGQATKNQESREPGTPEPDRSLRRTPLTWTAPSEDADSVTGYEVLRAVGEGEMATLAADTGSTATSYTDATATGAGETYAYQVKAIRGEDPEPGLRPSAGPGPPRP